LVRKKREKGGVRLGFLGESAYILIAAKWGKRKEKGEKILSLGVKEKEGKGAIYAKPGKRKGGGKIVKEIMFKKKPSFAPPPDGKKGKKKRKRSLSGGGREREKKR